MDRVFSFLLWPKREARGPWKQGRKKRGSITCRTDRANEANKMFVIWLCWLFRVWKGDRELEVRTATYGPGIDQSQHAKAVSQYDNIYYFIVVTQIINQHPFRQSNNYLFRLITKQSTSEPAENVFQSVKRTLKHWSFVWLFRCLFSIYNYLMKYFFIFVNLTLRGSFGFNFSGCQGIWRGYLKGKKI